jgi:hypothetical protein
MKVVMRALSGAEATIWCKAHTIALTERGLPARHDAAQRFNIPEDAGRRIYLLNLTMNTFRDAEDVLIWFDDWSVWPSVSGCIFSRDLGFLTAKLGRYLMPQHIFSAGGN